MVGHMQATMCAGDLSVTLYGLCMCAVIQTQSLSVMSRYTLGYVYVHVDLPHLKLYLHSCFMLIRRN